MKLNLSTTSVQLCRHIAGKTNSETVLVQNLFPLNIPLLSALDHHTPEVVLAVLQTTHIENKINLIIACLRCKVELCIKLNFLMQLSKRSGK